jgi:FkbM family methyltransferase
MEIQHNPVFWTISKDGKKVERNLKSEIGEKKFSMEGYYNGERGIDDINYMYHENFNLFELHDSNGSDYERYGCKINEGDTVVDIGGNIGMFTRRALERGASRVISFEPMSKAYACLVDNVGYEAECHKIAIGTGLGSIDMSVVGNISNLGGSTSKQEMDTREIVYSEKCITMSLGDLWDLGILPERINFLKIDCEGGEKEIIESLTDEHLSKIDKISMEYHASILGHGMREEFGERAVSLGFQRFTLFHGDGALSQLHLWR